MIAPSMNGPSSGAREGVRHMQLLQCVFWHIDRACHSSGGQVVWAVAHWLWLAIVAERDAGSPGGDTRPLASSCDWHCRDSLGHWLVPSNWCSRALCQRSSKRICAIAHLVSYRCISLLSFLALVIAWRVSTSHVHCQKTMRYLQPPTALWAAVKPDGRLITVESHDSRRTSVVLLVVLERVKHDSDAHGQTRHRGLDHSVVSGWW